MTPEQTRKQHAAQKDLVERSLLVSASRSERSEERPRKHVKRLAPPVFTPPPNAHRFVFPTVNEKRPL